MSLPPIDRVRKKLRLVRERENKTGGNMSE